MYAEIGVIDVLAMLGLFMVGFAMWVAWEMIVGRKALGMLLAFVTFTATWSVAGMAGIRGPLLLLLVQGAVASVLVLAANSAQRRDKT